ncbi:MAG: hypothetical protein IPM54_30500 [Polyangiaceae bacterium]|nr:hypothetical protein [Polyangiaceae bacterium]
MKRFPRVALAASAIVLSGAHQTSAVSRAIPGFALGGSIDTHDIVVPVENGREPMDQANLATRLHPSLRADALRLENTPRQGITSRQVFPSNWWPQGSEGIAARWNSQLRNYADWTTDRDNLAPTEKYDLLFYPGDHRRVDAIRAFPLAESRRPANERRNGILRPATNVVGPTTAWELTNHGTYQNTYPESWWGHCNGWASYVTAEKDAAPLHDILVRLENDQIVMCAEPDPSCVLFRTADIEALMSEIYFHDTSTVAGRRCNTARERIARDARGRPIDPACRDLNPATLHLALTGLLGQGAPPLDNLNGPSEKLPFVMDYAYHDEVWTFPVIGYEIRSMEYLTEAQAARLVCRGTMGAAGCRNYQWNENATRFARVEMAVQVMAYETTNAGLLSFPLSRPGQPAEHTYHYVLEMDGRGTILGGEWIVSPTSIGPNSKEMHPDFIFMAVKPEATSEDADDRGGRTDNPYISSVHVRELLRLSRLPVGP